MSNVRYNHIIHSSTATTTTAKGLVDVRTEREENHQPCSDDYDSTISSVSRLTTMLPLSNTFTSLPAPGQRSSITTTTTSILPPFSPPLGFQHSHRRNNRTTNVMVLTNRKKGNNDFLPTLPPPPLVPSILTTVGLRGSISSSNDTSSSPTKTILTANELLLSTFDNHHPHRRRRSSLLLHYPSSSSSSSSSGGGVLGIDDHRTRTKPKTFLSNQPSTSRRRSYPVFNDDNEQEQEQQEQSYRISKVKRSSLPSLASSSLHTTVDQRKRPSNPSVITTRTPSSSSSSSSSSILVEARGTKQIVSNNYYVHTRGSLAAAIYIDPKHPILLATDHGPSSTVTSSTTRESTESILYRTTRTHDVAEKRTNEYRIHIRTTRYHNFLTRLRNGHTHDITCIHFTTNNQNILSGSTDNRICLWSIDDYKILHVFTGHTAAITGIYPSPMVNDTTLMFVSSSMDGTVKLWRTENDDPVCRYTISDPKGSYPIYSMAWSHDGSLIVTTTVTDINKYDDRTTNRKSANALILYNIEQLYHDLLVPKTSLTVSNDSSLYCIYRIPGVPINKDGHTATIRKILWSMHDDYIFSGGDDKIIRIWSLNNLSTVGQCEYTLSGHTGSITDMHLSPGQGTRIVSASMDGTAKIWLWTKQKCLLTLRRSSSLVLPYTSRTNGVGVTSVAFTIEERGRRVITAYNDGTVCVWNSWTGILYQTLSRIHQGSILSLSIRNDGIGFATASHDQTIGVWYSLPLSFGDDLRHGYWYRILWSQGLTLGWLRTQYYDYMVRKEESVSLQKYPSDQKELRVKEQNQVFTQLDFLLQHGGSTYIQRTKKKLFPERNGGKEAGGGGGGSVPLQRPPPQSGTNGRRKVHPLSDE